MQNLFLFCIIACMCTSGVTNSLESLVSDRKARPFCNNSTIIKVLSIVLGLLLVGGAIAAYIYQVNAIAVYTMGGVGGVLILTTVIRCILHCFLQRYSHIRQSENLSQFDNPLRVDKNSTVVQAAPWDGREPQPLPEKWKKHQAEQTIIVEYAGTEVTISNGDTYFTYEGKIAIGFHGSYNPPSSV
jgi:hypothetical protein